MYTLKLSIFMIPHLSMKGNPFEIDGTKILTAKKTMHSLSNYIKRENVPFNIFVVELNQLNGKCIYLLKEM